MYVQNLFYDRMEQFPVIAAVKDISKFDSAVKSPCEIIFLMCGSIFNIKDMVSRVKEEGKIVFIHVDLIDGFARDATAIEYIQKVICPDGIISTKNSLIKIAKELGLLTVQRVFILDSLSVETALKSVSSLKPDAVEILPGIMPKVIKIISEKSEAPLIAGGLIRDKEDVINALNSGASGVSSSVTAVWDI